MAYYIYIKNNKIIGCSEYKDIIKEAICTEVSKDIFDNIDKYIYSDGEIVLDSKWEEKQKQKERERINSLTMSKRELALALQKEGISYTKLKELISNNEQAQLEWDLCVALERSNPLLNLMGAQLGITPEQIDDMFRVANGEEPIINEQISDIENTLSNNDWELLQEAMQNPKENDKLKTLLEMENVLDKNESD